MLERYLAPAPLLSDGRWLHDYFQRRLDAARSALDPIDAFVPTADADRLMDAWIVKTPARVTMTSFQWEDDSAVAELHATLHHLRRERDALLKSTSWRITAPLRLVMQGMGLARDRHYGFVGIRSRMRRFRARLLRMIQVVPVIRSRATPTPKVTSSHAASM
jgi:hypothetical protein